MNYNDWQEFEKLSLEYLNSQYGDYCEFNGKGGHDSTFPDIIAEKNGNIKFCIEAKSALAQCGQFVLIPNFESKEFIFSDRNKSPQKFAIKIMEYMNNNFSLFSNPSSKGVNLEISESLIYNWVFDYYSQVKNTKFFISEFNNQFIISHITNLPYYFNFSATYRIKTSGSSLPSKKDSVEIIECLKKHNIAFKGEILFQSKNCQIVLECDNTDQKFILFGEKYRFQFSRVLEGNLYSIRRLSNTRNANVIFTIESKKEQQDLDIKLFLNALK